MCLPGKKASMTIDFTASDSAGDPFRFSSFHDGGAVITLHRGDF